MAQAQRNLQTQKTSRKPPMGRFNPATYFRNRRAFTKLREGLREHHMQNSSVLTDAPQSTYNGITVSINRCNKSKQVVILEKGGESGVISVKHNSYLSIIPASILSPVAGILGAQIFFIAFHESATFERFKGFVPKDNVLAKATYDSLSWLTKATYDSLSWLTKATYESLSWLTTIFFDKFNDDTIMLTGAIVGASVGALSALALVTRSITSPAHNRELYDFVKNGDEGAIRALKEHLKQFGNL